MQFIRELLRRCRMLLRRDQHERDLADEMQLHLDLRTQALASDGLSAESAHTAARRRFGNARSLQEQSIDSWGWHHIDRAKQDLRFGLRSLLRTPGFTAIAVIALALGIGANTAIFSVVNSVLLNPLSYASPDQLVTLLHNGEGPAAAGNYVDWRDQSRSFSAMGAAEFWSANLTGGDNPERVRGLKLTQSILPMLGTKPLLGRVFAEGEDRTGADHEVILSHRFWMRHYQGDPSILGKTLTLTGEAYTVIGVMPRDFRFAPFWATKAELWVPLSLGERAHSRSGNSLRVFARLKPDVNLQQARSEIASLTARLEQQYPGTNRNVRVTPLKENVVGKVQTPLLTLLAAVGFVLLIACANVAHMLLARTSDRQKEIALRTALGADRSRVMRQFLTENLLLASVGAFAGLLFAWAAVKALIAASPAFLPRADQVSIDLRVVLFLLATTILTAVLFGLAPALHAAGGNLSDALKASSRAGTDNAGSNRLRAFLVSSEFTLAFMLLIGAGLMIRSFFALQSIDPGFRPENVVSMEVSVNGSREESFGAREAFYRQLLRQVRSMPGVVSAGGINHLPLAGDLWGWVFMIEGRPRPRPGDFPMAVYRIAMPGYFETMRIPLKQGRLIAESDDSRSPGVAVINQRAASEYFPGQDPIGKRITFDTGDTANPVWLTVVGVTANVKQLDWSAEPFAEVYLAALQHPDFLGKGDPHFSYLTLVVRTDNNPASYAAALRQTVWSIDRNLPISEVHTMESVVDDATAEPRFEMLLLSVFAGVALVLAAVGIYGVMSYAVARRTREIGIRMSLGATRSDVLRMVMRNGMGQALSGSLIGIAGALLLSRFMANLLYGVKPTDTLTFSLVIIVLGSAAMLASFIPARRATRIEPVTALRNE